MTVFSFCVFLDIFQILTQYRLKKCLIKHIFFVQSQRNVGSLPLSQCWWKWSSCLEAPQWEKKKNPKTVFQLAAYPPPGATTHVWQPSFMLLQWRMCICKHEKRRQVKSHGSSVWIEFVQAAQSGCLCLLMPEVSTVLSNKTINSRVKAIFNGQVQYKNILGEDNWCEDPFRALLLGLPDYGNQLILFFGFSVFYEQTLHSVKLTAEAGGLSQKSLWSGTQ